MGRASLKDKTQGPVCLQRAREWLLSFWKDDLGLLGEKRVKIIQWRQEGSLIQVSGSIVPEGEIAQAMRDLKFMLFLASPSFLPSGPPCWDKGLSLDVGNKRLE